MYEAVAIDPDDPAALEAALETATTLGYDGLILRDGARNAAVEAALEAVDPAIDVVPGVEIDADLPQQAGGSIGNYRPEVTVLSVAGGTPAMNRFAVESEKVDVLARPMADEGDLNHVVAKAAAENGVRIEVDLGPVLRESGGRRVRSLQALRKLVELVDHYDAPYVVSANAAARFELRSPRELAALGEQIGLSTDWIEAGLAEWGTIVARNRRVQSESFIEPGVERGRHEPDG
ncbi:RNase P subunit p30 family protein [Halovivax limisalsi]|uniref:RNase P subunit p30 family protein n=1 Tax=Halovivax limisalsi TaxID=1453760 RepID=UPI001FFD6E3F|nr:RNase P subunit p30 family protein [Halovivax limisalsi]